MPDTLAGTGTLLRLALRRDRWLLPAWVLGFTAMAGFSASATADLYPTVASRIEAADVLNATPSLVALYGRVYDPTSLGSLALIKLTAFGASMVAVLMIVITVRHTRAEEAEGRLELLGAGVVGRDAPLAAALALTFGSSVALGLLTAVALVAAGLPAAGAVAFGLSWAGAGIAFGAVAAVTAQVTTGSRAATGLAAVAVAAAYLLRAVGDMPDSGPTLPTWLSPIGWTQQVRPFAGDRFVVLLLPALFALVLIAVAVALRARRDLGSGLLSDRRGPPHGGLGSTWDLSLRLNRGALAAWAIAIACFGVLLGSLTSSISGMLDSPAMQDFFIALGGEQGIVDAFLAAELAIIGSLIAAYGISSANHLRSEEAAGHAEVLLATDTSRLRWATSLYGFALAGVALLLALAGLAVGIGHALDVGNTDMIGELVLAGLARVPAAWVLAAMVMAVFGWAPRLTTVVWGLFAGFVVLVELGALWDLPQWLMNLSPFVHSPKLPGNAEWFVPLAALTAIAALLTAVGYAGWRRRDIAG
jgi:polyether ionophore transport system permease protein